MHIGEVLDGVYDDEVGWRAASGSIKPVHVANGLLRAVVGRYYDVRRLVAFLVPWKKGGVPDELRTADALLAADENGVLEAFSDAHHDFDRARKFCLGILAADSAVFPSAENSALTLTCPQMVTRAPNDRGLGDFGAALLRGGAGSAGLSDLIAELLRSELPQDPMTAAVWPLLERDGSPYYPKERAGRALRRKHNQACVSALQDAAACLATHERAQGNRIRTLQRTVEFVCVATHAHAQALAAGGKLDQRPPALVAVGGAKRSDIAAASEDSLDGIYDRFEAWLAHQVAERLAARKPLDGDAGVLEVPADGRGARALFLSIGPGRKPPQHELTKEELEQRMSDFLEARREAKAEPHVALAQALVFAHVREYESGGPRPFLQGVARKAGLLYPPFQGRAREKRVRPSVPVLDMLVRACVPAGQMVPLDEFLETLWQRFGLITGGRRTDDWDDAQYLASHGIRVDAGALLENAAEFVDQIDDIGLAHRFADNVTFVGDRHVA